MSHLKKCGTYVALSARKRVMNDLFSKRIKAAKDLVGLNHKEFAARAGLKFSSHNKYVAGTSAPGAEALFGYLQAGISANYIVGGIEPILVSDIRKETSPGAFDPLLMQEVIEIVEQLLDEHRRVLPPPKKAELLVTLYEMFRESATPVHRATVLRLVNLAA